MDIPVTIGMECRATMAGTRLQGRRTNNPDQVGVSYMTIQSVPHDQIDRLNAFFAPYRTARDVRNRQMIEKINREVLSMLLKVYLPMAPAGTAPHPFHPRHRRRAELYSS